MSTRRDVAGPLQLAAAHTLLAHRALGRMSVSATVPEFSDATAEFMAAARGVAESVAALTRPPTLGGSERRRAFMAWFATELSGVLQHPAQRNVASEAAPAVYLSPTVRASEPQAFREVTPLDGTPIGRLQIVSKPVPRPEDFYFEGAGDRPAIVLCAEYLECVTHLLDRSKATLRQLGLE